MSCPSARSRSRGFTLVELLVAIALLATLGTFLVQLVRGCFKMYSEGDRRGDLYHTALHVLEMLEDDLLAIHPGPEGRLLLQIDALEGRGGAGDGFFLRLVRTAPGGEQAHPHLRHAGTAAGGQESWDGRAPLMEDRATIAPPTGLIEVAYALVQEPTDPQGILTLYRGSHAPALSVGGFFTAKDGQEHDESWVRATLRPVASDILGLWLLCFGQESEDWGELEVIDGKGGGGLASMVWDSTRGLLPSGVFPLAVAPESALDPRDDIFPRRLRILLQVARAGSPETRIRRSLSSGVEIIHVSSTEELPAPDEPDAYVKLGDEWLEITGSDGSTARVRRGRRHTGGAAGRYPPGTPVYAGALFRKTLALPANRSYFGGGR